MKKIAFFDFDGTITRKDSLLKYIQYSKGLQSLIVGLSIQSPWILAYKLRIISAKVAKERVLRYFFGGTPLAVFQNCCDHFSVEVLPTLIRPKALSEIRNLQRKGVSIVIVSASPENWIRKWAEEHQICVVATRLKIRNKIVTGEILGRNCHGREKVDRILQKYDLTKYSEVYAYGDRASDRFMLQLAQVSFYRPFRT